MTPITLTPAAIAKIAEILREESDPTLNLRIFIQGGGCSGFQYGFTLDNTLGEDDEIMRFDELSVIVDAMSVQYMQGAVVDYVDDLTGSQFKILNPLATSTCGCGSSFSV